MSFFLRSQTINFLIESICCLAAISLCTDRSWTYQYSITTSDIYQPCNVILPTGAILLCFIMITFIVATIPLTKSYKSLSLHSCISIIETLFITAVVLAAFYTYSTIVQEGMNLDGVKGYILSLAPTIPVSIFLWFIKKKYFGQQFWKTGQMVKKDALSKEEMITLLVPTEDLDQVV